MSRGNKYFIIYKPKGCLSQFSKEHGKTALVDLFNFPKDIYPVGRLDQDSEGLLILSNDKSINALLLNPKNGHWRTYWVQVSGQIDKKAIKELQLGVDIFIQKKKHSTLPAKVKKGLPPKNIPHLVVTEKNTSWFRISIQEGKNRQVRKMTAKVGFPTLRLVRTHIELLDLGKLQPGDFKQMDKNQLFSKLGI
ncbi:MAG: pseudouridine synthase [Flavobacteriales bacterium]|nr:pseudouridine synthase [Flavobacteriales bacterium]|tara:strand:- start:3605 stop:4183 length:579 start_codon:yes stop_codon:yes gene_type:complete